MAWSHRERCEDGGVEDWRTVARDRGHSMMVVNREAGSGSQHHP